MEHKRSAAASLLRDRPPQAHSGRRRRRRRGTSLLRPTLTSVVQQRRRLHDALYDAAPNQCIRLRASYTRIRTLRSRLLRAILFAYAICVATSGGVFDLSRPQKIDTPMPMRSMCLSFGWFGPTLLVPVECYCCCCRCVVGPLTSGACIIRMAFESDRVTYTSAHAITLDTSVHLDELISNVFMCPSCIGANTGENERGRERACTLRKHCYNCTAPQLLLLPLYCIASDIRSTRPLASSSHVERAC